MKDEEHVCPIIVGTISWFLGKKIATQYVTHKWVRKKAAPALPDALHDFLQTSARTRPALALRCCGAWFT